MVLFAGKTVLSTPECFECTTLAKKRYINTLPFRFPYIVPYSNAAKTRNLLKFAGVPQTRQQISAVRRPKFTIL